MDKKINDINEMIDHNQEDDDEVKDANNHCSSNRSTPTSEKEKNNHEDDDDAVEMEEARDNGDRCSVKSGSVNKNSVSTRTMAEELALKDKEVRRTFTNISINYSPALLFASINFAPTWSKCWDGAFGSDVVSMGFIILQYHRVGEK